ncbi:MAG: pre-peptidase C-terminal domain-containing protein [Bacteroidia bacterium]
MKTVFERLEGFRTLLGQYALLFVLIVSSSVSAQTLIDQQSFSGNLIPSGWTGNDIVVSGGYAKFATTGASLSTPSYNLSAYHDVTLSFEFANETVDDGGPVTVSISSDGGNTYTAQTFSSPSPTGVFFASFSNALTVFSSDVKINFSRQGGAGALKFREFKLQGIVQPQLLLNGSLSEDTLQGASFVAELTVGSFAPSITKSSFTLVNAPTGLSIASVTRNSDTQVKVALAYTGADFDSNASLGLTIGASQTVQNLQVSAYNSVPLLAHVENITINPPVRNGLSYFTGMGPSVSKSFKITASSLAPGAGNVTMYGNAYYEVSTSENSGYAASAAIAYDENGVLSSDTFYVRLKSALAVGTYNTQALTVSGGKAMTIVVANGKVIGSSITNDLCANAETLDSYNGNISGTLASSTYTSMTQGDNAKDVWYRFVASCPGNYTAQLSGFSGNADLFLFAASCPTALTQAIASAQTTNSVETLQYYISTPGSYYIRVAAMNSAAEAGFQLNFHKNTEPPVVLYSGSVTNIGTTTATVHGTPQLACGALFYGVEYSTIQGFVPGTGVQQLGDEPVDGTYGIDLTGLQEDTVYYYRVWEINDFTIGYGDEQSFATTQPLIGTESVKVPVSQLPSFVTMANFRARWFMPGQYNFKLNVSTSPTFDTYLINETFAGFAGNGLIPVASPDAHFAQAGWTVDNVFEGADYAVVGASGQAGVMTSPDMDLSATGETYVSVDLSKYATDNTTVQVLFSTDGNNWTQLGSDLAVLADAHTFALPITGGTATSKIRIQTSPSSPGKRFRLDNVTVTNFQGTTQTLAYSTVSPTAVATTVNGTAGNVFYRQLTSLTANTTYYYRVRAESNGLYSAPSAAQAVNTLNINVQNGILYVRKDQGGNGESWQSPMSELADALYLAKQLNEAAPSTVRQIWVASGKYRPLYRADNYSNANVDDRDNAFVLQNGVSLYGGFAGFESSVNTRQYLPLSTGSSGGEAMLTGKVGIEEDETDNLYHIVIGSGITADSGTVVDGFVIRDSYTNGTGEITCNGNVIKRYDGGGVYNKSSEYELRNSLVEYNYVSGNGGGVYNENCPSGLVINASQISNNTAVKGGAVANIYGAPVIKATTIKNNTATANGGGVYNESTGAAIRDLSTITQNTGLSGGAIYNVFSTTNLFNVSLTANTADYGAGMYNAVANATIADRVRIKDNVAQHEGGALYIEGDSNATASGVDSFSNSLVTGNTAAEKGGAILYKSGTNALFSGINAGVVFTNGTFDNNTASGDGNFMYYDNAGAAQAPPVFRNSIIMNNGAATFVDTSSSGGLGAAIFNYVLTDVQDLGTNFNTGNNTLASDPQFSNASIGDYTLDTNSPAVNTGLTDYYNAGFVPDLFTVTKDFAGNERVYDGFIDKGAYEWQELAPCTITTIWNGASWDNGAPESIEYAAVFEGNYDSNSTITACSVTVNSGVVTIKTGHTLRVKGAVTVDPSAQLIIEDNAALLQVNNVINSGNISLFKSSNQLYRLDYTMWSSPVASQGLQAFSPATTSNRYYEYKFDFNGSEWVEAYWAINPAISNFTAAKGYLIRMPNDISTVSGYYDGNTATAFTGEFEGQPNNGNITVNLSVTGNRYTSVGNPYPSPISVYEFFATNSNVMDVTSGIYFWRKRNNSAASSYATLTMAAYVANPALGGGAGQAQYYSGASNSWVVAPGQGFLVRTKSGVSTPVLKFNNKMRRSMPGAAQGFFRQAAPDQPQQHVSRYWVNIMGAENGASQMAVAYMDEATTGFDYGYDGRTINDDNYVNIYTLQEQTSLTIQARPAFADTDRVKVGFNAYTAGSYTINLDRAEGVFTQGQHIYLKDLVAGTATELTEAGYVFTTEAGTFNDRFEIVYTTEALHVNNPIATAVDVVVYKQGGSIKVETDNTLIKAIEIYDIRGRRIYADSAISTASYSVDKLHAAHEMIIMTITTDAGTSTKKIIF